MTANRVPHFKLHVVDGVAAFTGIELPSQSGPVQNNEDEYTWTNGDDAADSAVAPVYMVNNILETDSHGMLYGASMSYKTFIALSLAFSICTGKKFFKNEVFSTGKVLYICGEGRNGISRRLLALKLKHGGMNRNFFILDDCISIDNKPDMEKMARAIRKIKPLLVIIDTFSSLTSDTDENSNSAVSSILKLVRETCRETNKGKSISLTSSMVIHHSGKDSSAGMRGASAFKNDVDYLFIASRANSESMITTLSCEKQKNDEEFKPFCMAAQVVGLGLIRQDGTDTTSLVLMDTDENPEDHKKASKTEKESVNQKLILDKLMDVFSLPDSVGGIPKIDAINKTKEFYPTEHKRQAERTSKVIDALITKGKLKLAGDLLFPVSPFPLPTTPRE